VSSLVSGARYECVVVSAWCQGFARKRKRSAPKKRVSRLAIGYLASQKERSLAASGEAPGPTHKIHFADTNLHPQQKESWNDHKNKILDGLPSGYGVSTNPRPAPNPKP
jgi:hypothetical protein